MKLIITCFITLLMVGTLLADPYSIATQQARNAVAKEEQAQQNMEPTPPPAPAPPPGQPQPNPALEATLRNIASLRADFDKLDSNPTNQPPLTTDLTAAAQGMRASPATVSRLAGNLSRMIAGNKKLSAQHQKLAQNIHALFNGSHLSPAQKQMLLDGVQKILLEGGVSADDTAKVISDLKIIATETN